MEQVADGTPLNRTIPLLLFVAVLAVMGLHHWYVLTEHSGFLMAMFLLPPLGMLALGGIIYPPVLYSVGKYGRNLPLLTKAAGFALLIVGLAIGFYLFRFVYHF